MEQYCTNRKWKGMVVKMRPKMRLVTTNLQLGRIQTPDRKSWQMMNHDTCCWRPPWTSKGGWKKRQLAPLWHMLRRKSRHTTGPEAPLPPPETCAGGPGLLLFLLRDSFWRLADLGWKYLQRSPRLHWFLRKRRHTSIPWRLYWWLPSVWALLRFPVGSFLFESDDVCLLSRFGAGFLDSLDASLPVSGSGAVIGTFGFTPALDTSGFASTFDASNLTPVLVVAGFTPVLDVSLDDMMLQAEEWPA